MYQPTKGLIASHENVLIGFIRFTESIKHLVEYTKRADLVEDDPHCLNDPSRKEMYKGVFLEELKLLLNYVTVVNGLLSQGYLGQLSQEAEEAMMAVDDEL